MIFFDIHIIYYEGARQCLLSILKKLILPGQQLREIKSLRSTGLFQSWIVHPEPLKQSLNCGKPIRVTTKTANIILCLKFLILMYMAYGDIKMSHSPSMVTSRKPSSTWSLQRLLDFPAGSSVIFLAFCLSLFYIISATVPVSAEKSMTLFMSTLPMTLRYTKGRYSSSIVCRPPLVTITDPEAIMILVAIINHHGISAEDILTLPEIKKSKLTKPAIQGFLGNRSPAFIFSIRSREISAM
jgi:hypothetical protein